MTSLLATYTGKLQTNLILRNFDILFNSGCVWDGKLKLEICILELKKETLSGVYKFEKSYVHVCIRYMDVREANSSAGTY